MSEHRSERVLCGALLAERGANDSDERLREEQIALMSEHRSERDERLREEQVSS